jgi:signal transduction histidine kinase
MPTMDRLDQRLRTVDPRVVDIGLAALLLVVGLAQAWPGYVPIPERWSRVDWIAYLLPFVMAVAVAALMLVRRRQPILVFALVIALLLVDSVRGSGIATVSIAIVIATYGLGRLGTPRRDALVALAVGVVVAVASTWALSGFDLWGLFAGVVLIGLWWVGDVVRDREARIVAYEEATARQEAERRHDAAQAASAERARIARELHDVIAHNVSVMVVQAAAASSVLDRDPEAARRSLGAIETTGREALTEMRRLLGVLRRDDEPLSDPQPSLARLPQLVDEMRAAGLPVTLTIEGDAPRLPPGVDLSAYRVIQEALTNVLRHAGPSPTAVALRYRADVIELEVTDDGSAGAGRDRVDDAPAVGGHGLAGMRERVDLVHGQLEAGPLGNGGFRILARLPTGAE